MSPFERQQMFETAVSQFPRRTAGTTIQMLADRTTQVGLSFVRSERRRRAIQTQRQHAIANVTKRLEVFRALVEGLKDGQDYPLNIEQTAANIVDAVAALWPHRS